MRSILLALGFVIYSSQWIAPIAFADDSELAKNVRELISAKNAIEAEDAFQAAIKEFPESAILKALHGDLYLLHAQTGKLQLAADHAEANLNYQLEQFESSPQGINTLANVTMSAVSAMQRIGKHDAAAALIDKSLETVEARFKSSESVELEDAINDLTINKINFLMRRDQAEAAEKLLHEKLTLAKAKFDSAPENGFAAARLANLLQTEIAIVGQKAPDKVEALSEKFLEFVSEQAKSKPDNSKLAGVNVNGHVRAIARLLYSDVESAEKLLESIKTYVATLKPEQPQFKSVIDNANRQIASLEQSIASEKLRVALIGRSAIPLDVAHWVNGDPVTDTDLKGKVVVLDFWAVWCGPCIATFPHLREWHDKYTDKGLEIIGVTKFYEYDWNDETKTIKRTPGLAPDQEQAAMVSFGAHHRLKHRFAVTTKESTFSSDYAVTGIPQVVLIDRSGIIRMIRVGSGDKNAHDLEQMIEKLLEEPQTVAVTPETKLQQVGRQP